MMNIYSVFDRAVEAYTPPFCQPSNNAAIRAIKNELANPDSQLAKHSTDFELWQLGQFNEQTGDVTPHKERVARIEDLK